MNFITTQNICLQKKIGGQSGKPVEKNSKNDEKKYFYH